MSNDIVVVSNDLNQVTLGRLKEQHQNLFFSILVRLRDHGCQQIILNALELNNLLEKNYTLVEITKFVDELKTEFFKLDFTQIKRDGPYTEERTINLFSEMTIKKKDGILETLTLAVSPRFEYMLNQLKANFTSFELANFIVLQSKYSKTLFRLLKQFKSTGKAYFDWSKFKELMGIPKYLKIVSRIEEVVLKPSIKELSWDNGQPDLFKNYHGAEKPFFKNLIYTKIKKNPKAKTSPIIGIEFKWDNSDELQKTAKNKTKVKKLTRQKVDIKTGEVIPVAEVAIPIAEGYKG